MAKTIIGVMGPGANPTDRDLECAYELGRLIARNNWVLLTGGRKAGVMDAASKGAAEAGGLVIGILPGENSLESSDFVDIPIVTGMGSARNNINVLTSHIIIACGTGIGTISEIMLALKAGKDVVLLNQLPKALDFFREMDNRRLHEVKSPQEAISTARSLVD